MISYVLTEEAESACTQIHRALGAHLSAVSNAQPPPDARLRSQHQDRAAVQRDAVLVRMMSITEAFCADRLLNEVEAEIEPQGKASLSQMWDSASVAAVSTWANQAQRYKEWLEIDSIDWKYVDALAIARNAIVHGLGQLTRQQLLKRQSNVSKLRNIGIPVVDDRVQVGDAQLATIADRCIAHIESVDEKVSSRAGSGMARTTRLRTT